MDKEAREKIARALFNPKLLELYSSMRWENLPDDIRESYLERAERLHNCFVELGYCKLKGEPPLLIHCDHIHCNLLCHKDQRDSDVKWMRGE